MASYDKDTVSSNINTIIGRYIMQSHFQFYSYFLSSGHSDTLPRGRVQMWTNQRRMNTLVVTSVNARTHSVLHISVTRVIWELLKRCVGTAKAKQTQLPCRLPREGGIYRKTQRRQGHFLINVMLIAAIAPSCILSSVSYLFYLWSCWSAHTSWL